MDIKFTKNNLCVNQIVSQKNEKFTVEGDEIVPDIKPDILSVVSSNGTVCVYKKEVMDGKVKLDGVINTYIVYIADDEKSNIRTINTSLDFSKVIEIKNLKSTMTVDEKIELQSLDCKILNGRKVSIRATANVTITTYSNETISYIENIYDQSEMELLNKQITVNALVGSGTTKVYAKDTVSIENTDNLLDIMKVEINITNTENKTSYNKILSKADGIFKIMYLTDDGRIETINRTIPIIGFIDMQDVSDENVCDVNYELKNIIVKPNNVEEHSIYIEAEYELLGFVYQKQNINIIEDLYGRTRSFSYEQKNVKVMQSKNTFSDNCSIRKQEKIDGLGNNKIYDVEVRPTILNTNVENGKVNYQGNANLTFIYSQNEGRSIGVKEVVEPFEFSVSATEISSKSTIQTSVNVSKKDIVITSADTVDMKIELAFKVNCSNETDIKIIDNITEDESRSVEKYSIVIYYTKPGDTLWNIAKRFGSTVEEIVKINNIEDSDKIMPCEQLFIPR